MPKKPKKKSDFCHFFLIFGQNAKKIAKNGNLQDFLKGAIVAIPGPVHTHSWN